MSDSELLENTNQTRSPTLAPQKYNILMDSDISSCDCKSNRVFAISSSRGVGGVLSGLSNLASTIDNNINKGKNQRKTDTLETLRP